MVHWFFHFIWYNMVLVFIGSSLVAVHWLRITGSLVLYFTGCSTGCGSLVAVHWFCGCGSLVAISLVAKLVVVHLVAVHVAVTGCGSLVAVQLVVIHWLFYSLVAVPLVVVHWLRFTGCGSLLLPVPPLSPPRTLKTDINIIV